MLAVFDFDKTLTDKDTLFGFYKAANPDGVCFRIKRIMLLFIAITMKLKIFGNDDLKRAGVFLFLKDKSEKSIGEAAKTYAKSLKLNGLYEAEFNQIKPSERMIVSASFDIYLKPLFPNEHIIASSLLFKDGKVSGLNENVYGERKKILLEEMGIDHIDCLYTDSYSDRPLMDISKKVYLVRKDRKEQIK